jgi:succinate-acetate transporter protein
MTTAVSHPDDVAVEHFTREGAGRFFPETASGTALTLASFSLTVALLSLINIEWLKADTTGIVIPVAYGYGSLAALVGGIWEFRANSLFGATLCVSFGCFWATTGLLLQFFAPQVIKASGADAFGQTFGTYLILWGVFAADMTIGAYFIVKPAFLTLTLVTALLFVLGISNIVGGDLGDSLRVFGGILGIAAALVSWYLSAALVINSTSGRALLPLWPYSPRS